MARRDYAHASKGQLYCIEWPEWHIECAAEGCDESTLVAETGRCSSLREAEKHVSSGKSQIEDGWAKRGGLWYCPQHAKGR